MTRKEFDLLLWLTSDNEPTTSLFTMPRTALLHWVQAHKGNLRHFDIACAWRTRMRNVYGHRTNDATKFSTPTPNFVEKYYRDQCGV